MPTCHIRFEKYLETKGENLNTTQFSTLKNGKINVKLEKCPERIKKLKN